MHAREAVEQDAQHVAESRAAKRRDDPDASREERHRAFARAIEQAFGLEPALQLIERNLQRADAARLHFFGVELQAPRCSKTCTRPRTITSIPSATLKRIR